MTQHNSVAGTPPATVRFFLGANSERGFYSLYDGFVDPERDFLWVLKGGPGCGKSSFMRRVGAAAEAAGFAAEYILCSGDPDSLDGVYFPEKRVAYVDGTAPHVIEAVYPGAASLYLDLGRFLDAGSLAGKLPEIAALNRQYKAEYARAYRQLSAGAALLPGADGFLSPAVSEALDRKLAGIVARELPKTQKSGSVKKRFLSAQSCRGRLTLTDSALALCPRIWALDNALGLGHEFLVRLLAPALSRGYDVILCPDPLEPQKPEALLLPELGAAFFVGERKLFPTSAVYRHLRLDAMIRSLSREEKALLRQRRRESAVLLHAATESLARTKEIHDELEAVYRPYVDFTGLDALTEAHVSRLLEK